MPNSNHSDASTPSPSITSSIDSVNSTPLLSPKGGFLVIEHHPFQSKPPDDDPIIERMATLARSRHLSVSPPSSSHKISVSEEDHVETRSSLPHSHRLSTNPSPSCLHKPPTNEDVRVKRRPPYPRRQYHPYTSRSGPIPPGLHYAARSLGLMSPTDLTLDQVEEQRDTFVDALSAMPDRILQKALRTKRATHDCVALRLALTIAEIKSAEERISLLSAIREQHDADLTTSEASLDILNQVLGACDIAEAEANRQYYMNEGVAQLVSLSVARKHVSQIYDVIGPGCSRWLGEDNGGSTLPFDDDSDDDISDE